MPFLTRDLPPGGRHVDRTVLPAVPLAPAAARARQLLPVGLLIAASSAGAALSPMLGGGTSAVAEPSHEASSVRVPGTIADADHAVDSSTTRVDRAAYVLSRDDDRQAGRHRAPLAGEESIAAPASTSAGGRHRASGTAVETALATQQAAPKHASTTPATAPATKTSKTTTTAEPQPAPTVSSLGAPTTTAAPTTTQQGDATTATVAGVGELVGGVLGTVGALLGGN